MTREEAQALVEQLTYEQKLQLAAFLKILEQRRQEAEESK